MAKINKKLAMARQDALNSFFSLEPKTVESINNTSTLYYYNWMLKKLFGVYEFKGCPDNWDLNYMLERLFLDGIFCITDTALGVLPLRCGVAGINVFNHPTECIIANPVLGNLARIIDENCALIKLEYDYRGIATMLNRYATMLSLCDAGISVNLINTKVTNIFGAETKTEAESIKLMYDKITAGEPGVFVSDNIITKLKDRVVFADTKNQFIAQDVENLKQNIINDFLSDIGINNANTEKRERLISNEVASNREEVRSGAEHWIKSVNEGLKVANKLFNLNLSFGMAEWNLTMTNKEEVTKNEP